MGTTRLSVVIPTHNRATDLRECLTAVVGQVDFDQDEVLVADDSSTDGTPSVLADFPQVRVVSVPGSGSGSSTARNAALGTASGTLVLFIDDDIVVTPDLVAKHMLFHEQFPLVEEALGGPVLWDPRKRITRHMRWLETGGPLFAFDTIGDHGEVPPEHFCTANVSVKRELLSRVSGPFDERLRRFTDVELASRLDAVGMRLQHDPSAEVWHLRSDTPRTTAERMREVGRASVELERVAPDLVPPHAPMTPLRRCKAAVATALSPIAEIAPQFLAERIWASRAAWAFSVGRRDAQLERES
ncbi:MAG: glycosyltransferase [Actinobacteria bacterium]|uniref:Unannotated protein n=1 Tax=freshwater metagenome TaxID=449393 RepID=A0A6J7CMH9_9ZZZZ|nr:glycosyltransferase [Actinomycetota bacterium]